ncbi:MAG: HPP family protein [Syntrophobacteraceae bacterium]
MGVIAHDIMEKRFFTLTPDMVVREALQVFKRAKVDSGQTVFGLLVTDAQGRLLGMLSMYDIFLLLRPKHIHIWGEMSDLDLPGILDSACERIQTVPVGDIMTTELITITPDTHVLHIIDIMIIKHVRRLPVLEDGKLIGIVYLSRVFNHLLDRMTG